jgi:formiminotetrahydrofolate cyclodeaminase
MLKSLIGSMSAITSIVLLLLVTTVTAGTLPDLDAYHKMSKEMKDHPDARNGVKLMWEISDAFKSYLCAVGSNECKAYKEYLKEHKLEKDENASKVEEDGLIADADKTLARSETSFIKYDALRIALIDVICKNEPEECAFWK